jgi:hypothetical protein
MQAVSPLDKFPPIGPVDGDSRLGIKDNSLLPSSFNGSSPAGPL